ncbi:ABC transporter substrate-binding protein [Alteribacter natronophilus]|uniref:ABC transporter substrate-binding protein n=1 Tax=Alteribacter natronophilus TaxID=2583810 RepID=UPI00110E6502|nr:ABC transporter substrate-binding protein [Alteribacter natronophilus]TMW72754.1 hypothetical protein FGB90_00115 [Alteribacter natronophilus]
MKLIDHYLRLFGTFYEGEETQVKLTREAAAETLGCSERNAIHVLNNLEEEGWMKRTKGRGRGNVTRATFMLSLEDAVDIYAEESDSHKDLQRFASLTREYGILEKDTSVMEQFFRHWFGTAGVSISGNETEDHLHIPYFRRFYSLDPAEALRQSERHFTVHIFNTLFDWEPRTRRVVPGLAHHMEADPDGQEWTFYLRKDVCFHNGRILTAEDVVFSLHRLEWLDPFLESAEASDNLKVTVKLHEPLFALPVLLTSATSAVVPAHLAGMSEEDFAIRPVGTGPFAVRNHDGEHLELAAHKRYFRERPHLDRITVHFLTSYEAFMNTEQIGNEPLPYLPFQPAESTDGRGGLTVKRGLSVKYLIWNMKKDAVRNNDELRKKVFSLVDRDSLVADLGYPRERPAPSFFKTGRMADRLDPEDSPPEQEMTQHLVLVTYDLPPNREDADYLTQICRSFGIEVHVRAVPYERFSEEAQKADLILAESPSDEAEEAVLWGLFSAGILPNLLDEDTLSRISVRLKDAAVRPELPERIGRLGRIEDLLITDAAVLPLYWTYQKAAFSERLKGVRLNAFGLVPFDELFFR